ncbi:SpvB/TcaC N-terminal domain-containing protein [Roseovarius sp. 2305UL8-3]|uniref:SpvB/TcaC N-terminal domain-containing protein n=1 Tax=Roseovarius conchicola TaxID=3121636 RepID=UPI0035272675
MSDSSNFSPSDLTLSYQVSADRFTGSAQVSADFDLPAGRNDLQPGLGLMYTSSRMQGPFGRGWALRGLPVISVDSSEALPRYDQSDGYASTIGGALIPQRDTAGRAISRDVPGFRVERFLGQDNASRIRFERWIETATGQVHWRSRDTTNAVTVYGRDPAGQARIADLTDPRRIYQWLPELTVNARGDAVWYQYQAEDLRGGAGTRLADRSRRDALAQRYLKSVHWVNTDPAQDVDAFDPASSQWAFHLVLDYGDHDLVDPTPAPDRDWAVRVDPFSTGSAGFDVRSWRLCRRTLLFHQFDDLGPQPVLTRTISFEYDARQDGSLLQSITKTGWRDGDSRAMPPLRFDYTQPSIADTFAAVPAPLQASAPGGVSNAKTLLADLYGEGLPGLLQDDPAGWFFQRNLGGGHFAPPVCVQSRPAHSLAAISIGDFDGDGNMDAVAYAGQGAGHYRFDREQGEWSAFNLFDEMPALSNLAGVQRLDLTGDGRADLVMRDGDGLRYYESRGSAGYAAEARRTRMSEGAAQGPAGGPPLTNDAATDYLFADMTGDGLQDQVMIRSGMVAYWPSHGGGRFGAPVVMENAPVLDTGGGFAIDRILLADLDGSGAADLIQLGEGELRIWTNQAGNGWSAPRVLSGLPMIDTQSTVEIADIMADGRLALVWSEQRSGRIATWQSLALSGSVPPGLIREVTNGMGRRDSLHYGHSAAHYLRDQGTDRAWDTLLPSHLITVDRIVNEDLINGAQYETEMRYRNGAYDGRTRSFAGFGEVDLLNAEFLQEDGSAVPVSEPLLSRGFFDHGQGDPQQARYWQGDPAEIKVPAFTLERAPGAPVPDPETLQDARKCLRGRVVREEFYAVGPDGPESVPQSVNQSGFSVRIEQPPAATALLRNRRRPQERAVLACFDRESSAALYGGVADDPRQSHGFVLSYDAHGAATLAATLHYPRRAGQPVEDTGQTTLHCEIKRKTLYHEDSDAVLSLNLLREQEEFALPGLAAPARGWFRFDEISAAIDGALANPLDFAAPPAAGRALRSNWSRQIYYDGAGQAADFAAPATIAQPPRLHHAETAVFSDLFATTHYGAGIGARLTALDHWLQDGHWWHATETLTYLGAPGFFRSTGHILPDGRTVSAAYDDAHLFAVSVTDPFGAVARSVIDYVALAIGRSESPTGAWSETVFDSLGIPVRASHGGTVMDATDTEQPWGFDPPVAGPALTLAAALADPAAALGGASQVMVYDLEAFERDGAPPVQLSILAGDLPNDGQGGAQANGHLRVELLYHDGYGELLSAKQRTEAGPAIHRDGAGNIVLAPDGTPDLQDAAVRWSTSGWVARNRKGEPIRAFEPYFSDRPDYEPDAVLQSFGRVTEQFFDAFGRVIRRLLPGGAMERAEFGTWSERHFDANDTVDQSAWRLSREILPAAHPERRALTGSLPHAGTPVERIFDSIGAQVRLREDGGASGLREVRSVFDHYGDPVRVVDARGVDTSRHVYDMKGRKIIEWLADSAQTQALFDARDNAVELTQANGTTRMVQFDATDRIVAVDVDTGGGPERIETITYADDPADADTLARNLLGQAVTTRDEAGEHRLLDALPTGQPMRSSTQLIADAEVIPDWSGAVALEGDVFTSRMVHDAFGRPVSEDRPDGSRVRARYTDGGHLSAVSVATLDGQVAETEVIGAARYSVHGQREFARLGNGVELSRSYDADTLLVRRIEARRPAAGPRVRLLQDLRYTYDPVGNITACEDLAHDPAGGAASAFFRTAPAVNAARFYSYDPFYRLTGCEGRAHSALTATAGPRPGFGLSDGSATERFTQTYTYDLSGNLTQLRHMGGAANFTQDFWVDGASNRSRPALGADGLAYPNPGADFAAAGEMRQMDHIARLEWRHDQRLARAVVIDRSGQGLPDDDEIYVYDGGGNRMRRITRRMLAGGIVERIEVTYFAGGQRRRIFRDDQMILERFTTRLSDGLSDVAELYRWTQDSTARETDNIAATRLRYTLGDHLGSATLRLDETANIISYEEYLPYGQRAFMAGDDAREVALKTFGFIGRERDDATGLHHIGQRYYASWLCRWISPDPAGDEDGPNLYIYAQCNPVTYLDPTGLQTTGGNQRGQTSRVTLSEVPQEVIDAINATRASDPTRFAQLQALHAANNFTYYIDYDGVVHLGSVPDMIALAEADLAAGNDVKVASVANSSDAEEGEGGGGDPDAEEDNEDAEVSLHQSVTGETDETGTETGTDSTNSAGEGDATDSSGTGDEGTGADGEGTTTGDDEGSEDGTGSNPVSTGTGDGGGGTSTDPNARGLGDQGTGRGAGAGDPNRTGAGSGGEHTRPGGTGSGVSAGTKPGGGPDGKKGGRGSGTGTDPDANGTNPDGIRGGSGNTPGGQAGGQEGGTAGGHIEGSLEGSMNGSATGSPGGGPDDGTGGERSSGNGNRGAQSGGSSGSGEATGDGNGNSQPGQGGAGGEGGNAQQPATVMDTVVRYAGYWNLEFGNDDANGESGGIPGGMGSLNLGAWGQGLYVALTVVDIVLTVVTLGGLAAIKAGLKLALKAGMRALTTLGRKAAQTLSVKGLRQLSIRGARQMSIYADNVFRWVAGDYMLQSRLYHWAIGKGGWRAAMANSSVGRWLLYGMTPGASAVPTVGGKFLGFWPYMRSAITNTATRLPNKIDGLVHESVHAFTNLVAWPVKQLIWRTPKGQPVFAVLSQLDEMAAYTMGRLASGRLHALPMVPMNALHSTYMLYFQMGGQTMARRAMGWTAAGMAGLGGVAYGAYRYLTGGEEEPAESGSGP